MPYQHAKIYRIFPLVGPVLN